MVNGIYIPVIVSNADYSNMPMWVSITVIIISAIAILLGVSFITYEFAIIPIMNKVDSVRYEKRWAKAVAERNAWYAEHRCQGITLKGKQCSLTDCSISHKSYL